MEGCREGVGACVAAADRGDAGSEIIISARVTDETQLGNANYPGKSIRNPCPFISITAGITQFEQAWGFLRGELEKPVAIRRVLIEQRVAGVEMFSFNWRGGSR
jgi:hypothetical protein